MPNLNSAEASKYIQELAATRPASVFYVLGASLSGRTYVCKRLERLSTKNPSWAPLTHIYTCKASDLGHEILTESMKEVLKRVGWRRKLSSALEENWPAIAKGLGRLAGKFVPEISKELDEVIEQITSYVKAENNKDLKSFPQTDVNKILGLLKNCITKVGGDGVMIIVDDIEFLSVPGLQLLESLLQNPCNGLTVVITANEDNSSLHQKGHRRLQAMLQKKSPETVVAIIGHSVQEIALWKLEQSGVRLSDAEAEKAYTSSVHGRSGLLFPWITSAARGADRIELEAARLYGQLEMEFNEFDPKTQRAVEILSRAYPEYVSLKVLADLIELPLDDVIGLSDRLRSGFAKAGPAGLALKRFAVLQYVYDRLGPAVLSVGAAVPNVAYSAQSTGNVMIAFSIDSRLETISQDLRRGAIEQAHEHIRAALLLNDGLAGENKVRLLQQLAEVHEQQGEYRVALQHLSEAANIAENRSERCRIEIAVAENHFRLGETSQSLKKFNKVRKDSADLGERDIWFKAMLRSVAVSVERDKPSAAIRLMESTLKLCEAEEPPPRVKCHLQRTAARAMVLRAQFRNHAQELAKDALRIATDQIKEPRAVGNSLYAFGDVCRHAEQFDAAREYYRLALGQSQSNFDLRVYCYLGIAATAISCQDDEALRSAIDELSTLPIESDSPESKAIKAFQNFLRVIENEADDTVGVTVANISHIRQWQRGMNAEIMSFRQHRTMKVLRDNVAKLQIIL